LQKMMSQKGANLHHPILIKKPATTGLSLPRTRLPF